MLKDNNILDQWLETDILNRVVDMIIYSGTKNLEEMTDKWPDEWSMYKECAAELAGLDWFSLKAVIRKVLLERHVYDISSQED